MVEPMASKVCRRNPGRRRPLAPAVWWGLGCVIMVILAGAYCARDQMVRRQAGKGLTRIGRRSVVTPERGIHGRLRRVTDGGGLHLCRETDDVGDTRVPRGGGRPPLMFGADASRETAGRGNQIRHILSVVLALNLAVAGAKLGYGFVSGSVAMSADGFHSLLDGFANVVGIVGIAVAARPPDLEHHFGHGRYETIASMAIGALMAVGVSEDRPVSGQSLAVGGDATGDAALVAVMLSTVANNAGVTIWERRAGTQASIATSWRRTRAIPDLTCLFRQRSSWG